MADYPLASSEDVLNKSVDIPLNKYLDVSDNFILLKIDIDNVDQFLLHKPIHMR